MRASKSRREPDESAGRLAQTPAHAGRPPRRWSSPVAVAHNQMPDGGRAHYAPTGFGTSPQRAAMKKRTALSVACGNAQHMGDPSPTLNATIQSAYRRSPRVDHSGERSCLLRETPTPTVVGGALRKPSAHPACAETITIEHRQNPTAYRQTSPAQITLLRCNPQLDLGSMPRANAIKYSEQSQEPRFQG